MAQHRDSSSSDLSSLIDRAASDVKATAARRPRESRTQHSSHTLAVLAVVSVVALAYFGHGIWRQHVPPSKERVAQDLEHAIDLAQASINTARATTGELPAALPNASLASVVRYEPGAKEYKLTATMMGVRVTLERDGTKSREQE